MGVEVVLALGKGTGRKGSATGAGKRHLEEHWEGAGPGKGPGTGTGQDLSSRPVNTWDSICLQEKDYRCNSECGISEGCYAAQRELQLPVQGVRYQVNDSEL